MALRSLGTNLATTPTSCSGLFKHTLYFCFSLTVVLSFNLLLSHTATAQSEDDLFNNIDSESYLQDSEPADPFADLGSDSDDNFNYDSNSVLDMDSNIEPILKEDINTTNSFQQNNDNFSNVSDQAITNEVQSLEGNNKPKDTKRVKFIKHPGQKQGLYKISADGKYYYKVEQSKQKYGLALKGGAVILNQLENPETGVTFNDIYGSGAKGAFFLEYYYSYFKNKNVPNILKKARVKFGSGLLFASGEGNFNDPNYAGVNSRESFTFLMLPNHLGLHLSLEIKGNQLIVPFVTGALEYNVGIEIQNENLGRTKFLGQLGAHFGGGLALSLGWLDEAAKFDLDHEFGINQTYLTAELRQNIALQSDFDFTATFLNIGLQLEF
jgi:hypothetical protein